METTAALEALLRLTASGNRSATAAVELLINHAMWLDRSDFRSHIDIINDPNGDVGARIKWADAHQALDAHELPCSRSEEAVLRVAASIAGPYPVVLSDELGFLDVINAQLVVQAIMNAALGIHD